MDSPIVIKKADLEHLVELMHKLRSQQNFSYRQPIFETLVHLKKFLEDLFARAAKDSAIQERAGAFHPNMNISSWCSDVYKKPRKYWLWIGCEAHLKRSQKKLTGIDHFGAALLMSRQASEIQCGRLRHKVGDMARADDGVLKEESELR